jgi:hypothetical protein
LVSVIKRPTLDVEDVVKILITQEKDTAQHADLADPARSEDTAGRIKKLQDTG